MRLRDLDITKRFIEYFYPSIKRVLKQNPDIPYANNVIFKNIILFGFPGAGKTTLANSLAAIASKKYQVQNVNARIAEDGDLSSLLYYGLEPKLINILFCDNTTLAKQEKQTLTDYFRLRNIFRDTFNKTNGYILSLISLHRYHGVPIELRSCIDGVIIRDISLNPYDEAILKSFIKNKELFDFIRGVSDLRSEHTELYDYSIFIGRNFQGILKIPPSRTFYFKEAESVLDLLKHFKPNGVERIIE